MSRLLTTFSVYAVVVLMVGCAAQCRIGVVRDDADFHYKMNRHSDAVVLYQEIADRRPGDWEGQYKLGLCLLELKMAMAVSNVEPHVLTSRAAGPLAIVTS